MDGRGILRVRATRPLIHSITNAVTANDVANLLLAAGASPIMAEAPEEVEAVVCAADGVNLNLGQLNAQKREAILCAGAIARHRGRPVVLDPVGVGLLPGRRALALKLIGMGAVDVVRGNHSEIAALFHDRRFAGGIDVSPEDRRLGSDAGHAGKLAASAAKAWGCIVVVSGEADAVSDGTRRAICRNGVSMMSLITGTGCQLSALIAAFLGAGIPENGSAFETTVQAVCAMGICAERGASMLSEREGSASLSMRLIDAMGRLDDEGWKQEARYEIFED